MRKCLPIAALTLLCAACASRPAAPGAFLMPVEGASLSSAFGEHRGRGRKPHAGMDLRAPHGTPVAAAASGRVSFRGVQRGFGNLVVLDHGGGAQTYYAHLSDFAVGHGETVARGQVIGFVGRTGNATGAHLHFELRENGRSRDPARRLRL